MIPLVDLRAQYLSLKPEVDAAIGRVLESGQFILGPEVAAFEEEFAGFCGAPYGVGVNSGTSALHLALLAAGVGPGDEVVTTPFTFVATVAAIQYAGATPVFVDVDPATYTLDPAGLEAAITPRTRAVVPVHLYGQPADMTPVLAVARRRGLVVIEDACQAHGAEDQGRRVGALGDMGCFSFYPGKNLGAYGEGGIVVTANPELAHTIRMLRDWGAEIKHEHVLKGFNYRLESLQAAILRVKLRRLEDWTGARRAAAERYRNLLGDVGVAAPVERPGVRHVYHVYAIRVRARQALRQALAAGGVETGVHYPAPVHLLAAYADLRGAPGDFPHAELAASQELSLPIYPELQPDAQSRVVEILATHLARGEAAVATAA